STLYFRVLALSERLGFLAKDSKKCERDGARSSAPDRAIVHLDDWHDFPGRARQKRLVSSEQVLVAQHGLANGNAALRADLEQELARDARQQPGVQRRRQRGAVPDDEEIRRRALRELAAIVAHHALEAAPSRGFLRGDGVVQQVVRLDQRI